MALLRRRRGDQPRDTGAKKRERRRLRHRRSRFPAAGAIRIEGRLDDVDLRSAEQRARLKHLGDHRRICDVDRTTERVSSPDRI